MEYDAYTLIITYHRQGRGNPPAPSAGWYASLGVLSDAGDKRLVKNVRLHPDEVVSVVHHFATRPSVHGLGWDDQLVQEARRAVSAAASDQQRDLTRLREARDRIDVQIADFERDQQHTTGGGEPVE